MNGLVWPISGPPALLLLLLLSLLLKSTLNILESFEDVDFDDDVGDADFDGDDVGDADFDGDDFGDADFCCSSFRWRRSSKKYRK